ncbi:MAG: DUF1453 domain-containing protein [Vicinamibacteria bacterium]
MPFLILLLVLPLVVIALMPLILIQRYRMGTARRLARLWVTTLNLALMAFSVLLFLTGAAVTAMWVPNAFGGAFAGLVVGTGLGLVGLVLTRWEPTAATLHYTPNRWLVLVVTFMVSARVLYGFWRSWKAVEAGVYGTQMVLAFGIPQSLAVGGAVIGYYVAYGWGVRRRVLQWQRRPVRVM